MELDLELKKQAVDWANTIYNQFTASLNPANPLVGEALEIYRELDVWGWFKLHPLDSNGDSTRFLLATRKYGKLKWAKDHPPKPKISAWELVAGKGRRRR